MTRILLVIDDYNEMVYLQTLLKKLGFDVDALSNARKLDDTLLGFNPKIIVLTAHGKKINGIELANSLMKRNGYPKIFLIKNQGQVFTSDELQSGEIDKILDSPVNFLNLIKNICEVETHLNFENISNKLSNLIASDKELNYEEKEYKPSSPNNEVSSSSTIKGFPSTTVNYQAPKISTSMEWDERRIKYNDFINKLKNPPEGSGGFSNEKIKEYNKKNRVNNRSEDMEELDQKKKDFVRALFSHIKKSS